MALAGIIYVVSPLDIIPDFLFFGFVDDIAIITWAVSKMGNELSKYAHWKNTLITNADIDDDIEEVSYEEIDRS
jgi:uncharacterized membrane protein YkvA (DUF1232 family)